MIKLNTETIKKYVRENALKKRLETRLKELGDSIKEAMQAAGLEMCDPAGSPFRLVKYLYDRSEVSYEDMAKQAYRKLYGKEWKDKWEEDKESYGTKSVVALRTEPNPKFKE